MVRTQGRAAVRAEAVGIHPPFPAGPEEIRTPRERDFIFAKPPPALPGLGQQQMSLKQKIRDKALELGFADVGFATPEPFSLYAAELASRPEMYEWRKTLSRVSSLRDSDLTRFIDPARSVPGVKSLIVVTDGYFQEEFPPSLAGKIGRCYLDGLFCPEETAHSRRRKELKNFLRQLGLKVLYGPAPARLAGARAGITTYGKNGFAFAREAAGKSSWIVNEPYLVDAELAPDEPTLKADCPENCRQCLDACPTGALYTPLKMDPRKCIAYLTYFQPGVIPRDLRSRMGTWVYGCDLCQEACPRNRPWMEKAKPVNSRIAAREKDFQLPALLLMSQDHYEGKVWPRFYYIRKENRALWQRNAAIALGNQRDPQNLPPLTLALEDPEPIVRIHAAWALGKIGGAGARRALETRRRSEEDETVRREIEDALD
jgi:epoxyqueuosine reductase